MPRERAANGKVARDRGAQWRLAVRQHPDGVWQGCVGLFDAKGVALFVKLADRAPCGIAAAEAAESVLAAAARRYRLAHLPIDREIPVSVLG